MGTTISVKAVEVINPPITTVANSELMMPPEPPEKAARGSSAKLVVKAVIRMGRRRTRAPVMSASRTGMPLARNCSTKCKGRSNNGPARRSRALRSGA